MQRCPAPLKVVDFFSGAGGMALGFHAAGFEIAGAMDFDEDASETLRRNFRLLQPGAPPLVLGGPDEGDVQQINMDDLYRRTRPDVLIGGPPCQAFSRAGRAKLDSLSPGGFRDDPRNLLYRHFAEAVEQWQPRAFVMENVPGMLSVGGQNIAEVITQELEACGYATHYVLLNAAWYGVPQERERLFFIGFRNDLGLEPDVPPPTHRAPSRLSGPADGRVHRDERQSLTFSFHKLSRLTVDTTGAGERFVTTQEALGDLPLNKDHLLAQEGRRGDFRVTRKYRSNPHSAYAGLMRAWPGLPGEADIDDHEGRRTPRDYETFKRMRPGDRYPQALAIARARFSEALAEHAAKGNPVAVGSPEYSQLERSIVPPYPEEIFVDKWRKLIPDEPSWTVPAHLSKDSYSHIHYDDDQARMISVREAARLQSFPDAFRFHGSMGSCFRQIGNAVPPLLARAIGEKVICELAGPKRSVIRGARYAD